MVTSLKPTNNYPDIWQAAEKRLLELRATKRVGEGGEQPDDNNGDLKKDDLIDEGGNK